MNKLLSLLLISFCWSCTESSEVEKYQDERDNIVNVKDELKEIVIEDVLIGNIATPFVMGNYLLIEDYKSSDKLVHIFDTKTFEYCTSTVDIGAGPSEIANMGHIGIDEIHNKFYVSDRGKQKIFSYNLDSILVNPFYVPHVKMKMNQQHYLDEYVYGSDTLCIASIIEPTGDNDYKPSVAKWNMTTGEIKVMKYEHPEIKKKRSNFTASMENDIYIEYHYRHDLITICSLNGDLKYNIYGPAWKSESSNQVNYYGHVVVCHDKIIASYSGENALVKNKNGEMEINFSTKLLVFNLNGNYLKTLETESSISSFCYDKNNNRIILSLKDEIQFAYLDLNGLVD